MSNALPPIVDGQTWRAALDDLRKREKAATRELDAIAAQRRRLPMVELPNYTLIGADGPIRLADVFDGRSQLIVYHHMWSDGAEWQCGGCTGFTSQFTRLGFLDNYDKTGFNLPIRHHQARSVRSSSAAGTEHAANNSPAALRVLSFASGHRCA